MNLIKAIESKLEQMRTTEVVVYLSEKHMKMLDDLCELLGRNEEDVISSMIEVVHQSQEQDEKAISIADKINSAVERQVKRTVAATFPVSSSQPPTNANASTVSAEGTIRVYPYD